MATTPGSKVPTSGIYKCSKCGHEATCVEGEPFPPCANDCRGMHWKLVRETNR